MTATSSARPHRPCLGSSSASTTGWSASAASTAARRSPNVGVLTQIGPLGVDPPSTPARHRPGYGRGLRDPPGRRRSGLYRIDLASGAATLIGKVAGGRSTSQPRDRPAAPATAAVPARPGAPPASSPAERSRPARRAAVADDQAARFTAAAERRPDRGAKVAGGTKVSYTLSAAATVNFVSRKGDPQQTRLVQVAQTDLHPQRSGRHQRLPLQRTAQRQSARPGRYRLTGSVGTSSRSATFKVLEPPR